MARATKKAAAKKVSVSVSVPVPVPVPVVPKDEGTQEFIVTGIVPTPVYNPRVPVFSHHASTYSKAGERENGSAGRVITVRCSGKASAQRMIGVLRGVLRDVKGVRADDI